MDKKELTQKRDQCLRNKDIASKRADTELEYIEAQLAGLEVTYSIGDRFKQKTGKEKRIIVAVAGIGESLCEDYAMWSNLQNGHGSSVKVKHFNRITPEEMAANLNNFNEYERYWDNRKKEYTDGRDTEDLEEFRITNFCVSFGAEICDEGVKFKHRKGYNFSWFALDEATEIHQKLGQLIATARRQQ